MQKFETTMIPHLCIIALMHNSSINMSDYNPANFGVCTFASVACDVLSVFSRHVFLSLGTRLLLCKETVQLRPSATRLVQVP